MSHLATFCMGRMASSWSIPAQYRATSNTTPLSSLSRLVRAFAKWLDVWKLMLTGRRRGAWSRLPLGFEGRGVYQRITSTARR
jgi:hypothetical protein